MTDAARRFWKPAVVAVIAVYLVPALFAVVVAVGGVVAWRRPDLRRRARDAHRLRTDRRDWMAACFATGLATPDARERRGVAFPVAPLWATPLTFAVRHLSPRLLPARRTAVGVPAPKLIDVTQRGTNRQLHVQAHGAVTAERIERAAPALAAFYGARDVRVRRDPANAALVGVTISGADALAAPAPIPLPGGTGRASVWAPIAVGVDEDGAPVTVTLPGRSGIILGGVPGAGKSNLLTILLRTFALDPDCRIVFADAKGALEAEPWRPVARIAGTMPEALDALRDVLAGIDRTRRDLRARGLRHVPDGAPTTVVVVDELGEFLVSTGTKADRAEFLRMLRSIAQTGRATGTYVIAATQRPSASVVPTDLRDLVDYRIAFRAKTSASSDMLLGVGAAGSGYDASTLPAHPPGIGWLDSSSDRPRRFRAYRVDDDAVAGIVAAAAALRGKATTTEDVKPAAADPIPVLTAASTDPTPAGPARPVAPKRAEAKGRIRAALAGGATFASRRALIAAAGFAASDGTARAALADLIAAGEVAVDGDGLRGCAAARSRDPGLGAVDPVARAAHPAPSPLPPAQSGRRVVGVLTDYAPPDEAQGATNGNGRRH